MYACVILVIFKKMYRVNSTTLGSRTGDQEKVGGHTVPHKDKRGRGRTKAFNEQNCRKAYP